MTRKMSGYHPVPGRKPNHSARSPRLPTTYASAHRSSSYAIANHPTCLPPSPPKCWSGRGFQITVHPL